MSKCKRCGRNEAENSITKLCSSCNFEIHPDFYKKVAKQEKILKIITKQAGR